jgi:DNA polymerase (family 10)
MDNYAIADHLTLLSKLMDIHGENAFKSKAYAAAAFALEKLPQPVAALPKEKISAIRGIGESAGKKITELLETGEMTALKQLLTQTPEGVLEMMNIKGLGPKKIHTLWKALHIDSIEALQQACEANTVAEQKGFGEKTQQNILEAIRYQQENEGKFLYVQVEDFAEGLQAKLDQAFGKHKTRLTGDFRRQLEVIEALEWVTTIPHGDLKKFFDELSYSLLSESAQHLEYRANSLLILKFYLADERHFDFLLFTTTGSDAFVEACKKLDAWTNVDTAEIEHELFKKLGMETILPCLRETPQIIEEAKKSTLPNLIQISDINGLIHAHSNWSDGGYSIEEMAQECMRAGFEYLVLSDHSKAAFYANGLSEARILEQHRHIEELNKKLAPFKIFKSIECDILNDGELDYSARVLSSFDVVIASIHSNLQMPQEKAMQRLLGAIANPYVSILGHMTGRLLNKRKGYPVDHKKIIDACAAHNVVIEINAAPQRLDIDWRWIGQALERGVLLSINPDAHTLDDYRWLKYGVLTAQKGGLSKEHNLSSMTLAQFEAFLQQQKAKQMRVAQAK